MREAVRADGVPPPPRPDEQIALGFDFGERRVGVALGNGLTRSARPLEVVEAQGDARWARIAELVARWDPARLVVGVPRQPERTPHQLTGRCERFARQLAGRFDRPVARVDERYSSVEAARALREAQGPGRGNGGAIDAAAAAVILQQWYDEGTP